MKRMLEVGAKWIRVSFSWLFTLGARYFRVLDRVLYATLEDLVSWRNKMILGITVLSSIFCFTAINVGSATLAGIVFGSWSLIVGFYFHVRQRSEEKSMMYGRDCSGSKQGDPKYEDPTGGKL